MASERLTDTELDEAFDYAHGSLRLTAALSELRERRAADLQVDDYEAVNLLWLLRVARTLRLDTGDWHAQLVYKLKTRGTGNLREANWPESVTAQHIAELRGPALTADEREALTFARDYLDGQAATAERASFTLLAEQALAALDKLLARGGERL
jgi:hypothetical protein